MAIIATMPSPVQIAMPVSTGCMTGLNHRVNVSRRTTSATGQKNAYRISHIHLAALGTMYKSRIPKSA
jgi:hypothetical protein